MNPPEHIVSGIYASRAEAETVRRQLVERGLPQTRVSIVESPPAADNRKLAAGDEALKDVLVDGAAGAAVGTGIGALAEVALVAANVSLFVASPLVAPLAMLGWGAALGGLVGAAVGAGKEAERPERPPGKLSDLVLDAIRSNHVVLLAHTRTAAEKALAYEIIGDSVTQRSPPRD